MPGPSPTSAAICGHCGARRDPSRTLRLTAQPPPGGVDPGTFAATPPNLNPRTGAAGPPPRRPRVSREGGQDETQPHGPGHEQGGPGR